MLTKERLDELYVEIVEKDNRNNIEELENAINNGESNAKDTLNKVIDTCITAIEESNDFKKAVTLDWCMGIHDSDERIKEYCLQYYEKNRNSSLSSSAAYGCILNILFNLENNLADKQLYFDEYLKVACSIGVYSNDDMYIDEYYDTGIDINKHIAMFIDKLKSGKNPQLCLKWLVGVSEHQDKQEKQDLLDNITKIIVSNDYVSKMDLDDLWKLFNVTISQESKTILFAHYCTRTNEHDELVKDYIHDIATYAPSKLEKVLKEYLNLYGYENKELELLCDLINNNYQGKTDSISLVLFLKKNNIFTRDIKYYPHLEFAYYIAHIDLNAFDADLKNIFTSYNMFRNCYLYEKIKSLNIPIIGELIKRIEELNSYSDTDNLLNEKDMYELTYLLRHNMHRIYRKMKTITMYDNEPANMKVSIENINIFYTFERKKYWYEGTSVEKIVEQAKIVIGLMNQYCERCNCEEELRYCRFNRLKKYIYKYIEEPSDENANDILDHFGNQEENDKCINKELWKELLKLKRMLMDRSGWRLVFGYYDDKSNTITLYLGNIFDCKSSRHNSSDRDICDENNYEYNVLDVFAHETFHAYHARCIKETGKTFETKTQEEEIVVESLASYFENAFNHNYNLERAWKRNTIYSWPYAGAKHLMVYGYDRIGCYPKHVLFAYVFKQSIDSLTNAFDKIDFGEKMEFEEF